jgi:hypothetical protein
MSYTVFCTFDLKNATKTDYENAHSDLENIGLERVVTGTNGEVVIPTTSVYGKFNGSSVNSVRDDIRRRVKEAFSARGLKSEIFVVVGKDGTWGSTTT